MYKFFDDCDFSYGIVIKLLCLTIKSNMAYDFTALFITLPY